MPIMLQNDTLASTRNRLLKMHYESGVGHIGGNLSVLDAMMLIFHEYLGSTDRFVLSKGHAAGALYATLWSLGRLTDKDLQSFHRDGTLLAGHPPAQGIPDIAFATGSLGHGLSLAAGTALAWRLQNRAGHVFCVTSDGEWQEGSTWEALIFAQHHKLNNLTVVVDHNGLQGFGSTRDVASMAPLWEKIAGFDVAVDIAEGHDLSALRHVLDVPSKRTKVVVMQTTKGHGVGFMENKMEWHYLPMNGADFSAAVSPSGGTDKVNPI
jgi:transketolase